MENLELNEAVFEWQNRTWQDHFVKVQHSQLQGRYQIASRPVSIGTVLFQVFKRFGILIFMYIVKFPFLIYCRHYHMQHQYLKAIRKGSVHAVTSSPLH